MPVRFALDGDTADEYSGSITIDPAGAAPDGLD